MKRHGLFLICLFSVALVIGTACNVQRNPEPRYEQTGVVTIATVDWYNRSFVVVFPNHVNKLIDPLCIAGQTGQVWPGAKMNIKYHWEHPNEYYGCYVLDEVKEIK